MRLVWIAVPVFALTVFAGSFQASCRAALAVYLDFTKDLGNGAGGGSNGIHDWVDHLNKITTAIGIPAFTPLERSAIQTGIVSQLETIYGSFDVTFTTTVPGGSHERINYGAFDATPGSLGLAPLDFMNQAGSSGSESSAANVYVNNFGFIIETADPRPAIISQLTTALAGTGAHELGHAIGVNHHHAYGDPGIAPANYADTGGIQNTHIMATGPTGLDEAGRESDRTFSQWSNLIIEAAGGANPALHGTSGTSLASTVLAESDSLTGGDVGNTPATAKPLTLSFLPISGLHAANTVSTLSSDSDVDVYKFDVLGPSALLADLWSTNLYADDFDSLLRLFDTDGTTVLAFNDDTSYSGNAYHDGTFQSFDSNLLNIWLPTAGTYFLEVKSFGNLARAGGGDYNLIFGVAAIPEARAWLMLGLVSAGAGIVNLVRRNRRTL